MKHLTIKFTLALALGLGLTLASLGAISTFETGLPVARAAEHTVCSEGPPTCTFTSVQAAVDVAGNGDVIKVASGTYTDVNNYGGLAQVVYISKSVTIRGGYTTAFTEPPNPDANPTTLDAQRQGRVLYITGDISPTIEGLRITGGDATGLGGEGSEGSGGGGGVYVITATVTISNNQVFSNTAEIGGGLYSHQSTATLNDNIIVSNTAYDGGGLYFYLGNAELGDNLITANNADGSGGGLVLGGGNITLDRNTIIANTANIGCGGLGITSSDAIELSNIIVADNQAYIIGSGLCIYGSSVQLLHTTIINNSGGDGSGVYVADIESNFYSTVSLTNTILVSHTVGITVAVGNTATLESTLWGSGAWANGTNTSGAGTINATNNYTGTPAFVDPNGGNYHIGPTSAAIDKGVNAGVTIDIDGEIRPQGSAPDLGADETAGSGSPEQPLFLPIILKE